MGKYEENSYGMIYSDFARRLNEIVSQYEELVVIRNKDYKVPEEKEFESTLYVCVLQSLLTQFLGIAEAVDERPYRYSNVECVWKKTPPFWGIYPENIIEPENANITSYELFILMRNVLSHPVPISKNFFYTATYLNGKIESYRFVGTNRRGRKIEIKLESSAIRNLIGELSVYLSAFADPKSASISPVNT